LSIPESAQNRLVCVDYFWGSSKTPTFMKNMKNLKMLSFVLFLLLTSVSLRAQSTAPIMTEPIVTEQPATPGQPATGATVQTQVGGLLSYFISNGSVTVTGPRISGGTSTVVLNLSPYTGPGNGRTLTALFPLQEGTGDDVTFTFKLRRIGNGLDWTYSRVGRLPRRTDI
jgi:hypothetical protein